MKVERSDFTVKPRGFYFFRISFYRNYAKIIPNLFDSLSYTLSAYLAYTKSAQYVKTTLHKALF